MATQYAALQHITFYTNAILVELSRIAPYGSYSILAHLTGLEPACLQLIFQRFRRPRIYRCKIVCYLVRGIGHGVCVFGRPVETP